MGSFRHLGDEVIHRGHIWHLATARFEDPDGSTFARDIVRSPGAVAAVPLWFRDDVAMVTLVHQYRGPYDEYVYEIPAGMRDIADEPIETTAARELVEEVGLRAGHLELLSALYPSPGMTDSVTHIFVATDLSPVPSNTQGPEEDHMRVVELALTDALAMIERAEIRDAKTVVGLLLTDRQLAGQRQ